MFDGVLRKSYTPDPSFISEREALWDSIRRDDKTLNRARRFVGFTIAYNSIIHLNDFLHVDMPIESRSFISNDPRVIYALSHRSMCDVFLYPYAISTLDLDIPYIITADTLFAREPYKTRVAKLGAIPAKRRNHNVAQQKIAVDDLKEKASAITHNGFSLMFFPDGRSKDGILKPFKTTIPQFAIDENIPIVVGNISYFRINEEDEYIRTSSIYTFQQRDFLRFLFRYNGHTYINFDKPIIPSDISCDRKELSRYLDYKCLDLVTISPKNVVAYAKLQQGEVGGTLEYHVSKTLEKLEPHSDKFARFSHEDSAQRLIRRSGLSATHPHMVRYYANEIAHYIRDDYKFY